MRGLSPEIIKSNIQFISKALGFNDCRIAEAKRAPHADRFYEWVAAGTAGDMKWLERNMERRVNPCEVLEGAQSIICLAFNYYPGEPDPKQDFQISRYAWNEDYHDIVESMLKDLNYALEDMGGSQRYYVDTGPVLEKDFAAEAGLGWNGKSTVNIHKKFGPWMFLCEVITTLKLEPDQKLGDHCGKCTRCIDHCPTQAITGPRRMDARRCISYLTIELKGSIPVAMRKMIGDRIYGCDVCLEVCPWNRFAQISKETRFHARESIFDYSLKEFLSITEEEFRQVFAKSPIKRIKRHRFLRNVCVAVGNSGDRSMIPELKALLEREDEPLIKEHAEWAIAELCAEPLHPAS